MNNRKVKEMIKFSFYKNLQNKWFIIFNIITLLGIILVINWGKITSIWNVTESDEILEISIIDKENLIYDDFVNELSGNSSYHITKTEDNDYTSETIPKNLMMIEVEPNEEEIFEVTITSKEGIAIEQYNPIKDTLFKIRNKLFAERYLMDESKIEIVQRDLKVKRIMLAVDADNSNTKEIIKLFSSAFTYIITVFIFSKMANEIASEKQSKATEYILTTVSAKEYLYAKIFSNIAILLLQGLLMIVYYFIAILILNLSNTVYTDISTSVSFINTSMSKEIVYYILTLLVYNVLNLILLCIIQATFASKTSSTSEAGNTTSLLLFVMMAAYASTIYFLKPYTKVNAVLYVISCIPLLSAYFVPGMMVIGQATITQVIVSLVVLLLSIPFSFHFCAKVFKDGILDYTKSKKHLPKNEMTNQVKNDFFLQRDVKNFGFVVGIAVILYVGLQTIFSIFGNMILTTLFQNCLQKEEISLLLQIVLQVVSLGIASSFVFAYTNHTHKIKLKEITAQRKIEIILIAVFLVFALQLLLSLVLYPLLGLDYNTTDLFHVDANSRVIAKIILVLAISFTPAFFEELFFRKVMMDFSMQFGKVFTLIFSALFFGLMHLNLSQGLFAFIMGLILGSVYLYTGDIKLTMLIHFINNGFAALELILPEIGVMVAIAVLFIIVLTGFVVTLKRLSKKEFRQKLLQWCQTSINLNAATKKYGYIFHEYIFDVALLLIFFMSCVTEKLLR